MLTTSLLSLVAAAFIAYVERDPAHGPMA